MSVTLVCFFLGLLALIAASGGIALLLVIIAVAMVRLRQGQLLGNSAIVSGRTFPNVDRLAKIACERVGIARPSLHVVQDPTLNAFAIGISSFSVVLNSATVAEMNDDELLFIIGHEFGHIRHGHTKWLSFIAPVGSNIPLIGLVFGAWQRKAEYTCDRAGLIASRNLRAAGTALMKLSAGPRAVQETDIDQFLRQTAATANDQSSQIGEWLLDHPYSTHRVKELIAFHDGHVGRSVRAAPTAGSVRAALCGRCGATVNADAKFCCHCGAAIVAPPSCNSCRWLLKATDAFCPGCGSPVRECRTAAQG